VTTLYNVHLRSAPESGDVLATVPYDTTLPASYPAQGLYRATYDGAAGCVAGALVSTEGDCGP
jgi:hypothetical protein